MTTPGPSAPQAPLRPAYPESSVGVLALVLGILSVVSMPYLGPVAWWLGLGERRAVDAGRRDPAGRGPAVAGYVLGIIGTVLLGIGLLVLVAAIAVGLVALLLVPVAVATGDGEVTWTDGVEQSDTYGLSDAELREQWLSAGPREPGAGSQSGDTTDPDRCDRLPWFEGQFEAGLTADEVTAAVGEPDSIRERDGGEVWLWNLGVCSFIDYDTYELTFEGGRLQEWRYVQG